ncbi:hypothetical protein [Arthrobacter sp. TWP1-1]|uniref:hypothetical protein n=1 Tax=Arthrobacter sp. TWP1-1 TaxID=2804568 RepID=UPI003CEEF36C
MSEVKFRMQYGAPAVLIGWLLTFVLFCVGLSVVASLGGGDTGIGWYLIPISLLYGLPVAVVVGLPLCLLIAWPLRQVRNQWIHVLCFAVGIGGVAAVLALIFGGVQAVLPFTPIILGVAACTAIGRASVIRMVARKNALVKQSDPAMVVRYGR